MTHPDLLQPPRQELTLDSNFDLDTVVYTKGSTGFDPVPVGAIEGGAPVNLHERLFSPQILQQVLGRGEIKDQ